LAARWIKSLLSLWFSLSLGQLHFMLDGVMTPTNRGISRPKLRVDITGLVVNVRTLIAVLVLPSGE